MNQTFELMVAWRYLRERGSRSGYFTMGVGVLFLVAAIVLYLLDRSLASLHPFELTDRQLFWKQFYQWGKIAALALGVLIIVFGFFHRLQSIFTTISSFGVFLGTAALVIVLSVMNGFEADLQHKILGSNAHILVSREDGAFTDYRQAQAKLVGLCAKARPRPCVIGVTPYLSSEVLVVTSVNYNAVIVKGIDPRTIGSVTDLPANIGQGSIEDLYPLTAPPETAKPRPGDEE